VKSVAVLLTDGYADWEVGYVLGVGGPFYGLKTQCVSPAGNAVVSQGGLATAPLPALEDLQVGQFGVLLICGGMHWERPEALDVGPMARQFIDQGATVAAICGATLALARTGLLHGTRHTSNSANFLTNSAGEYAGVECYVESAQAVVDGKLITAPGTATATFTAAVFRAAGVEEDYITQFLDMVAGEHRLDRRQV
jgi:putative intracellular protease/amidase